MINKEEYIYNSHDESDLKMLIFQKLHKKKPIKESKKISDNVNSNSTNINKKNANNVNIANNSVDTDDKSACNIPRFLHTCVCLSNPHDSMIGKRRNKKENK